MIILQARLVLNVSNFNTFEKCDLVKDKLFVQIAKRIIINITLKKKGVTLNGVDLQT